ncbi:hypothetical protein ACSSS7_002241 [Eimeria intestinalis]
MAACCVSAGRLTFDVACEWGGGGLHTWMLQQVLPPLSGLQTFLLGAVSKAVATVATYPYIRAKVLLQARLLERAANMQVEPDPYPQAQQEACVSSWQVSFACGLLVVVLLVAVSLPATLCSSPMLAAAAKLWLLLHSAAAAVTAAAWLALISGGTGASTAPSNPVGPPSSRAPKTAESGSRDLPRAGSMEPQQLQQLQLQQQMQQQPSVPRTMSAQSALHREAPGQASAALPTSAYICSDCCGKVLQQSAAANTREENLRKPASFCLSDCSEAGGLGICGSSDDGSGPSCDNLPDYKPRGPPSLADPQQLAAAGSNSKQQQAAAASSSKQQQEGAANSS